MPALAGATGLRGSNHLQGVVPVFRSRAAPARAQSMDVGVPTIIQIVPRAGRLVDGVGDYAKRLAAALQTQEQIQTLLLSGDPQDSLSSGDWRVRLNKVASRSPDGIIAALEQPDSR